MAGGSMVGVCLMVMTALSLCAAIAGAAKTAPAGTVLVSEGAPQASIVLAGNAGDRERLAATELQTHIQKMSGATLPIVSSLDQATGVKILIGRGATPSVAEDTKWRGTDPASFHIVVTPEAVALVGLSDQGTLFAAYELLEQLGVRWFMPGEIGTVIPEAKTVAVRQQDTLENPGFALRQLWWPGETAEDLAWHQRMRRGGEYLGQHGIPCPADRATEPELFAHENGQPTNQLRVSNPEVLRRTIAECRKQLAANPGLRYLGMGPDDGAGFGSDPWDANDIDPLNGCLSVTDRYIKFFNLVLADVQKDYPNVGIAFYSYSNYMRPPVREKPNPRIVPVFAPIDVCRFHSIDNPRCWERHSYLSYIVDGWQALGVTMTYRGYIFNLADSGLPFSSIRPVATEFPYYYAKGMIGIAPECHPAWSYHGPALYLAAKMMWDPQLNAQAVLDDYFSTFYGPAAKAMQAHFDCVEKAYYDGDYHTGNIFDTPHILTPKVMEKLEMTLRQAETAAPASSVYARRVRITRLGFDFGKAQLAMMAALNAFDFAEAKRQLARIQGELMPAATAERPASLEPDSSTGYHGWGPYFVERFWQTPVNQGYERVTGGNELAAKLPDSWRCMLDPSGCGDGLGLWRPEVGGNSWMPLRTYSQSWSDQGLRYYKGDAWYRAAVRVDARFCGRKLRLWIGGVDDKAAAWINGKPLPVLSQGEAPIGGGWEFDAADAVAFGEPNTVVVKVTNSKHELHEIGTGGITGPAMLWAAKP